MLDVAGFGNFHTIQRTTDGFVSSSADANNASAFPTGRLVVHADRIGPSPIELGTRI